MKKKKETRPGIWIAHIFRKVKRNVKLCGGVYTKLDMRLLMKEADMAIRRELRGGTHLLLFKDSPKHKWVGHQEFDLMVEDIDAVHVRLKKKS